jgi:hypothetical protein
VAAWNAAGLRGKEIEMEEYAEREEIDFVFISETWARIESKPPSARIEVWSPRPEESGGEGRRGRAHHGAALWVGKKVDRRHLRVVGGIPGNTIWWRYKDILFGGIYISPRETEERLEEYIAPPPGGETAGKVVMLGDFNMRLGSLTGDRMTTSRGEYLRSRLTERGFVLTGNELGKPTFERTGEQRGESIIDMIWTNLESSMHKEGRVVTEEDLGGSDHRLIYTRVIDVTAREEEEEEAEAEAEAEEWRINLEKLKIKEWAERYRAQLQEECRLQEEEMNALERRAEGAGPEEAQRIIDRMSGRIEGALKRAAEKALGRTRRTQGRSKLAQDPEYKEARRNRKRAFRRVQSNPSQENQKEYERTRREQEEKYHRAKSRAYYEFAEKVEEMEDTEMTKVISAIIKRKTRGGRDLSCTEEDMERAAAHFEKQFARQSFHREDVREAEGEGGEGECVFSTKTILEEAKKLAKAKAPGEGGLRNELLRYGAGEKLGRQVEKLFNQCWRRGMVPTAWRTALIHPVFKKGDRRDIANYRPISLTESMRKLFERCMLRGLTARLEPLDISQGGFREGRSTLDQIAALDETIRQRKEATGKSPIVAYLDIKAAYDTVDRRLLWRKLEEKGLPGAWIKMLRGMFDANESKVRIEGRKTRAFRNEMGLLQGSILSPILYAAFMDDLPKRLRRLSKFSLGNLKAASYLYADDIAIVADEEEEIGRMLRECEEHSEENGYRFSPAKCEVVTTRKLEETRLYGVPLKQVTQFVYLGMVMDERGIAAEAQVRRMEQKTMSAINQMKTVGMNGGGFTTRVKRRMYETFIRPKLEYGLQIIAVRKKLMDRIERVQHWALCTMFGVSHNTSDVALRALTGIQSMKLRVKELNAMYMTRVEAKRGAYMVREAQRAHDRKGVRGSVFAVAERNPMVWEYRRTTVWQGKRLVPEEERKERVKEIRKEERRKERTEMFKKHPDQVAGIKEEKGKTASEIDELGSRRLRRLVYLWLLKKIPGKPGDCRKCRARTTRTHVVDCAERNPTAELMQGRVMDAAKSIAKILENCLGMGTLEQELIREHTRWEKREAEKARKRNNMDLERGGNSWWRYYANQEKEKKRIRVTQPEE